MLTQNRKLWIFMSFILLLVAILINMSVGSQFSSPREVLSALVNFNDNSYQDFIIIYQRLPRTLIAIFVGASLAMSGDILQGISRNPLASPSLLGVTSGAVLFVVFFGFYLAVPLDYHGIIAFAGGWFGFGSCYFVAKLAGVDQDPRGLTLILAGAIISSLYSAIASTLVLADPQLWELLRSWINGDINHAYIDRLQNMWAFGVLCMVGLYGIARPLTLVTLGQETARATGVNVKVYLSIALFCVLGASTSAISIIGPIGFIGLVVPHITRPFTGSLFKYSLVINALIGGAVGCLVDGVARTVFLPVLVHSAVIMEFMGGLVFIFMVRKFYITPQTRGAA